MTIESKLKLYKNIDWDKINKVQPEAKRISALMHQYSNYDEICWSLFKCPKEEVFKEITSLLQGICLLDPELSWVCMNKQEKYKKEYSVRKHKSQYIKS